MGSGIIIFILLTFFLLAGPAFGASQNYWVSTTGSGSTCSQASPCALPSTAVTAGNSVAPDAGAGHVYNIVADDYIDYLTITNANQAKFTMRCVQALGDTTAVTRGCRITATSGQHAATVSRQGTMSDITFKDTSSGKIGLYLNAASGFVGNRLGFNDISSVSVYVDGAPATAPVLNWTTFQGNKSTATVKVVDSAGLTLMFPVARGSDSNYLTSTESLSSFIWSTGTGAINVTGGDVWGPAQYVYRGTGTATATFRNCKLQAGFVNTSSAIGTVAAGGTLDVQYCNLVGPFWNPDQYFTGDGTITDQNNTKTSSPGIIRHQRSGILVPCIDMDRTDTTAFDYATMLGGLLRARGQRGTLFVITSDFTNSTKLASYQSLQTNYGDVFEFASHTRHHSAVGYTYALNVSQSGGSNCTIAFNATSKVFTGSCDGTDYDFTYDATGKTIANITTDISGNGKGWTVARSTTGGQTASYISTAVPVTSLAALTATAVPADILFDRTTDCSTGYFKDEILGAVTDLSTYLGVTNYSFAFPTSSADATSRTALQNAGCGSHWSARSGASASGTGNDYLLASFSAYNFFTRSDLSNIVAADEATTKENARAVFSALSEAGGIIFFLGHETSDISEDQWTWILDVAHNEFPEMTITSAKGAMDIIKANWTTADNITYTRATWPSQGSYRLRSTVNGTTNAVINAGDGSVYTTDPTYSFDSVNVYGRTKVNPGAYQKNRYNGGGGLLLNMVGSAFYYKQAADE